MMHSNRHASTGGSESVVFTDGDILVLILASFPDFNLCSKLIRRELGAHWHNSIRTVLVDCSALEDPHALNLRSYMTMTRFIIKRELHLLVLDAPQQVCQLLEEKTPDAVLIDSRTAGYFGREMKARIIRLGSNAR